MGCDCDRYLEFWNLVFMQYDRAEDGTLNPLPKPSIDTGMGLERIAAILQGVSSNFETDILQTLIALAEEITGASYGSGERIDVSLRIIADHARAVTFLIADGVIPSNEGRGYVLRRLLRRAVRHGRLLGVEDVFLGRLIERVIELMGKAYPEIVEHRELIVSIVGSEEERFGATLRQGIGFLETELASLSGSGSTLDGRVAFALHDTYGFPFELTAEIAAEKGFEVDVETFSAQMEAQRERARAAIKDDSWSTYGGVLSDLAKESGATQFVGYERDEASAHVIALLHEGVSVDRMEPGQLGDVVLDTTAFYAEQGGQVGDIGVIETVAGARFVVENTKLTGGVVTHVGRLEDGALEVGDVVLAKIDVLRRERIRRNHTATHLLHWALRLVLGEHAKQAGSHVAPDRLRFDFTHFEAMTREQLGKVERLVNAKIFENHPARAYETSIASARETGVTALFGEKYGDFVRVLEVGNFSKELCGGTHVGRTSEIGFLKILGESSVGANLRRIEAVTSFDAFEYVSREESELIDDSRRAQDPALRRFRAHGHTARQGQGARVACRPLQADAVRGRRFRARAGAVDVGYPLVVARVAPSDAKQLRNITDIARARMSGGAVVFAGTDAESGKALLIAAGSGEAVAKGFHAGEVIKSMSAVVGGRGGGKADMAQGGGDNAAAIDEALQVARDTLGVG